MEDDYSDREQSHIKHFALRRYLETASRIIGTWAGFSYVDCCAGPWESRSQDFSDTSFGIAVKVLKESHEWLRGRNKNPHFRALLIEEQSDTYRLLARFVAEAGGSPVGVKAENWDFREHTEDIIDFVSNPPSFSFLFIDPKGWSPAQIGALAPLLRIAPGEVLINFMSSFVVRFLNDERTNLDDVLGSDYRELRGLEFEEQEDEAVRRYCDLIRRQGRFPYVCALPVMKRDQDAIHFFLIYATRNRKGVEVFKQVEKRTEEETAVVRAKRQQSRRANLDLFEAEVLYKREERYKRLSERNGHNARAALDILVSTRGKIGYDECWAEVLQFPTVYETDLRKWLCDMELAGRIRIDGRKQANETLKRSFGYSIAKL